MTEIMWLDTTKRKKSYLEVPGADVFLTKVSANKKDGTYKTNIYFVNDGDKKVTQGNWIMVGMSDQYIFLRDGDDTNSGRKIYRPTTHNGKPYLCCQVDFDKSFGPNVRSFYDKAFKLQWSENNKAWFIAHTGEVKQKEVL